MPIPSFWGVKSLSNQPREDQTDLVDYALFQTLHVIQERAIAWLLRSFGALLSYFGKYSVFIEGVALAFPSSIYLMNRYMNEHTSWKNFRKYVVCPKCHFLYYFKETYEKRGSHYSIKLCPHVHKRGRSCNTPLLKWIVQHSGKPLVYPHLIYSLYPL